MRIYFWAETFSQKIDENKGRRRIWVSLKFLKTRFIKTLQRKFDPYCYVNQENPFGFTT